ncbi:MAG: DEAD/DEAH box helicase [Pseudomonadales bacterium]|nr:DEAD/DEAH box helicase [Pseudomonadales bacterium]
MPSIDMPTTFDELGLPEPLVATLKDLAYAAPTPVQAASIPHLLAGDDLIGHAPTGTGKTAAFSLPLLARVQVDLVKPQILVLTPTRELAIQVSAAVRDYSKRLPELRALAVYGGQDYGPQLKQLRAGQHVIVGTPGRIMDHLRRGTLNLKDIKALVLDEADEMLKMGFLEDVEWILEQAPSNRQMALFSATMPKEIRRIATRFMRSPKTVAIEALIGTQAKITQSYTIMAAKEKPEALKRLLAFEPIEAALVFVRTKIQTESVAEQISQLGLRAAAIHGDLAQNQREQLIRRLSKGQLDILIATDVAARGLDVDRISHVINFDAPHDAETYVHRIGRTGRAGRSGRAIIFLNKREERLVKVLERETQNTLTRYQLPSGDMIRTKQLSDFTEALSERLNQAPEPAVLTVIQDLVERSGVDPVAVAAALAEQLLPKQRFTNVAKSTPASKPTPQPHNTPGSTPTAKPTFTPSRGKAIFRIEVGNDQSVEPREIVGAITNEGGLGGKDIGQIQINADHSLVELPNALPSAIFTKLKNTWIRGRRLSIHRTDQESSKAKTKTRGKTRADAKDATRKKPRKHHGQAKVATAQPRRTQPPGTEAESKRTRPKGADAPADHRKPKKRPAQSR